MKTYRYKGYTIEPRKIVGLNDAKWEVNIFGLGNFFATIRESKNWINKRLGK